MKLQFLSASDVELIHDEVITENELHGLALNKSLDAAIARISYRCQFGMIRDIYDLAATYAVVIATGHVFNDANKRTAYRAMRMVLVLNGIEIGFDQQQTVSKMVDAAMGKTDEISLAAWLRDQRS